MAAVPNRERERDRNAPKRLSSFRVQSERARERGETRSCGLKMGIRWKQRQPRVVMLLCAHCLSIVLLPRVFRLLRCLSALALLACCACCAGFSAASISPFWLSLSLFPQRGAYELDSTFFRLGVPPINAGPYLQRKRSRSVALTLVLSRASPGAPLAATFAFEAKSSLLPRYVNRLSSLSSSHKLISLSPLLSLPFHSGSRSSHKSDNRQASTAHRATLASDHHLAPHRPHPCEALFPLTGKLSVDTLCAPSCSSQTLSVLPSTSL